MQAEQNKDPTERQMTKIAREAAKFTVQMMKADGIGTAEFDFIHLVRHNPGMTQADVRAALKIDKGAAARRAASLETKGYLVRKPNPDDGRSQLLYATPKAEELKNSKAAIETVFYAWLVEELPESRVPIKQYLQKFPKWGRFGVTSVTPFLLLPVHPEGCTPAHRT